MGALCSTTVDKDGDDSPEGKVRSQHFPQATRRLRKIPHFGRPETSSQDPDHMTDPDMDAYTKALEALQSEERSRAFDAQLTAASSDVEKTAAEIVRKVRGYDWENTYAKPLNVTGKRVQGEH